MLNLLQIYLARHNSKISNPISMRREKLSRRSGSSTAKSQMHGKCVESRQGNQKVGGQKHQCLAKELKRRGDKEKYKKLVAMKLHKRTTVASGQRTSSNCRDAKKKARGKCKPWAEEVPSDGCRGTP